MSTNTRFTLRMGQKRLTVTLDKMLSGYLAIHLQHSPETKAARQAVREWLQQRIDEDNDPGRLITSRWLQRKVITALVSPSIVKAYDDWVIDGTPPPRSAHPDRMS